MIFEMEKHSKEVIQVRVETEVKKLHLKDDDNGKM
jgi:hypothetical protein